MIIALVIYARAFFRIWSVFRQEMENCNRSFVSSPFLEKTRVKEWRGRWNIAFSCYIEGLGAGRGGGLMNLCNSWTLAG